MCPPLPRPSPPFLHPNFPLARSPAEQIARSLFRWTVDLSLADFYECGLLNGILGVQVAGWLGSWLAGVLGWGG